MMDHGLFKSRFQSVRTSIKPQNQRRRCRRIHSLSKVVEKFPAVGFVDSYVPTVLIERNRGLARQTSNFVPHWSSDCHLCHHLQSDQGDDRPTADAPSHSSIHLGANCSRPLKILLSLQSTSPRVVRESSI